MPLGAGETFFFLIRPMPTLGRPQARYRRPVAPRRAPALKYRRSRRHASSSVHASAPAIIPVHAANIWHADMARSHYRMRAPSGEALRASGRLRQRHQSIGFTATTLAGWGDDVLCRDVMIFLRCGMKIFSSALIFFADIPLRPTSAITSTPLIGRRPEWSMSAHMVSCL